MRTRTKLLIAAGGALAIYAWMEDYPRRERAREKAEYDKQVSECIKEEFGKFTEYQRAQWTMEMFDRIYANARAECR